MRPTTEKLADTEHWVLTTEAGRELLALVADVAAPGPTHLTRWRKVASPEQVSAAMRLADGRRRGSAKFTRADRMWFEPTALEQATGEIVAAHKAHRFAGADVVDLCSGLGGDAIAFARVSPGVVAFDRDQGMLRRLLWNADVYQVRDRILAVRGRAETCRLPPNALVHIDPDRRASKAGRAKAIAEYRPGLGFLRSLVAKTRGGAIKLGPASDFADTFDAPDREIEVVSLGRECKEATVWFGELGTSRRRATSLPSGATWTDRDGPSGIAPVGPIGHWVVEPDPSLSRAGLIDGYALANGLQRVLAGFDLMTASERFDSPLVENFEVLASLPLDPRLLRSESHRLGLNPQEMKSRGVPEPRRRELARLLRFDEGRPATVFLLNSPHGSRAILAVRG